jgi:hypothetical protein
MSAYDGKVCISLTSSGDLSSNQYQFVALNSSGQVALAGDGERADGILDSEPDAANKVATVAIPNGARVLVKAGAATTAGGPVASDASGKAVDATSGDSVLGTFVEAASADGDVVAILFSVGNVV